jgi:hypothetical protein
MHKVFHFLQEQVQEYIHVVPGDEVKGVENPGFVGCGANGREREIREPDLAESWPISATLNGLAKRNQPAGTHLGAG